MTINETIIKELEKTYGRHLPDDLKRYILTKYEEEPFPHEFSEQDLYTNIKHDIHAYEAGELDVTVKSRSEKWQEERKYLQNLYLKKSREASELSKYVAELEHMLSDHRLESSRMAERRKEVSKITTF